ncbi:MAG: UDP-N-acetylmuramoyl-L-alanine--D-glutamate ligase [Chloroflexota bacterium]|nr:UDP-N-acetylmuramoyl-L-alanine--D-glutamate ligase [Chloroflexota bacterium]
MNFAGKRATIIGLAREGTALARFLAEQGAEVTVSDLKKAEELRESIAALEGLPIRYALGSHPMEILDGADTLFVSPGVPLTVPIVVEAERRGIPISTETRLFAELCPAPIIGVTGSSGKTTTVSLVGEMLKAEGLRTWVGGNIGHPLIGHLEEIAPADKVVMELSSFQLELFAPGSPGIEGTSPHVAAILNVAPDHLDRYPSMEAYIEAKKNIVRYQGEDDVAVLGYDDPVCRSIADECRGRVLFFGPSAEIGQGAFLRDEECVIRLEEEQRICSVGGIKLLGRHNVANILAACVLAGLAGASVGAMSHVAQTFEGVEHCLEFVRELRGVRYYNDSIATTPSRVVAALKSFEAPIILLAGGRDKCLLWDEMAKLTLQKVEHLVLFGEAAPIIGRAVRVTSNKLRVARPIVHRCATPEEAVEVAVRNAEPGDVVLLSPGGTSFDAFRDFAARGDRFKGLVRGL